MAYCTRGHFIYKDRLAVSKQSKLPDSLHLSESTSYEAIILRLLLGTLTLTDASDTVGEVKQQINNCFLPFDTLTIWPHRALNRVLNIDLSNEQNASICNKYFMSNRKNSYVHERILNEISYYYLEKDQSPIAGFVHLYRCLEFMSYCIPMIYSSKTNDYKGSYENLKKFLSGNPGEIKFFRNFVEELFKDEDTILAFKFEMSITSSDLDKIKTEMNQILNNQFDYNFEDEVFSVSFQNMLSLFSNLRNRYFHMLIGQGKTNFDCTDYNINDLFQSLNPYFINWFAIILCKIIQHGILIQSV